jgi:hypothetical protein
VEEGRDERLTLGVDMFLGLVWWVLRGVGSAWVGLVVESLMAWQVRDLRRMHDVRLPQHQTRSGLRQYQAGRLLPIWTLTRYGFEFTTLAA